MVRIKNRYLLVNILYPASTSTAPSSLLNLHQPTPSLTEYNLLRAIRHKIQDLFGDYGSGVTASSLLIKYFSPATSTFILRVSRNDYRIAWAALTFMDSVVVDGGKEGRGGDGGRECVFRVVRVSGTMRKAEEEAIRRAREMVLRARREEDGKAEGDDVLEGILGFGRDEKGKGRDEDVLMVDRSDSEDDEFSGEDD